MRRLAQILFETLSIYLVSMWSINLLILSTNFCLSYFQMPWFLLIILLYFIFINLISPISFETWFFSIICFSFCLHWFFGTFLGNINHFPYLCFIIINFSTVPYIIIFFILFFTFIIFTVFITLYISIIIINLVY